jgi:hypothetical protein
MAASMLLLIFVVSAASCPAFVVLQAKAALTRAAALATTPTSLAAASIVA